MSEDVGVDAGGTFDWNWAVEADSVDNEGKCAKWMDRHAWDDVDEACSHSSVGRRRWWRPAVVAVAVVAVLVVVVVLGCG